MQTNTDTPQTVENEDLVELPIEHTSIISRGQEVTIPGEKTELVRDIVGDYIFNWHLRNSPTYLEDQFRVMKVSQLMIGNVDLVSFLFDEYGRLPKLLLSIRTEGKNFENWGYDPVTQILHIDLDKNFYVAEDLDERFVAFLFHEFAHFLLKEDSELSAKYADLSRDTKFDVYKHETYTNALATRLLRKFCERYPGVFKFEKCRSILKAANKTYAVSSS